MLFVIPFAFLPGLRRAHCGNAVRLRSDAGATNSTLRRPRYELKDIRKVENLHVFLWLLKDLSWCALWRVLGMSMALPALAVAMWIAWRTRKTASDGVHNAAVCFWICANITWMTGEFYFNDHTRRLASGFFYGGMLLLVAYYGYELLRRFIRRV